MDVSLEQRDIISVSKPFTEGDMKHATF